MEFEEMVFKTTLGNLSMLPSDTKMICFGIGTHQGCKRPSEVVYACMTWFAHVGFFMHVHGHDMYLPTRYAYV